MKISMNMELQEENSLQKFTDADNVQYILRSVYRLTPEHISLLGSEKKEELGYAIKHKLTQLHGEAYDAFYYKVRDIMTEKFKNVTWDRNHEKLKRIVKQYVISNKRMPTVSEVADIAQMSRITVSKHLREFDLLDYNNEQKQMLTIMFNDLVGQVLARALQGDLVAVKLMVDIMSKGMGGSRTIFKAKNQQNIILGQK